MLLLGEVWLTAVVMRLREIRGHVQIDLTTGSGLRRQLRRLCVAHLVKKRLAEATSAMSLQLRLLDSARLHVHLLARKLLHLDLVCLVDKRFDCVQL